MQFLIIDEATGEILGWQRGGASEPPHPPAGKEHIVVSENDPDVIDVIRKPNHPHGGPPKWRWNGRKVVAHPDPRAVLRVTQIPNPGVVGDPLTIRIEAVNVGGQRRRNFDLTHDIVLGDTSGGHRRARLGIVDGIAERTFTPSVSGELELRSDFGGVLFQGDNPVVIIELW